MKNEKNQVNTENTGQAVCEKCYGAGWVWYHELDNTYSDDYGDNYLFDDTKYLCDWCNEDFD